MKSDDDAIFRAAAADAGNVTINKISWFGVHVISADSEKFSIYKTIESKSKLQVSFQWHIGQGSVTCFQFLSEQVAPGV